VSDHRHRSELHIVPYPRAHLEGGPPEPPNDMPAADQAVDPHGDVHLSNRRHVGWDLLRTMATLAFVFVILAGIGSASNLVAVSLSLPQVITVVVQILGYGLHIFAAIWFIGLAVDAWHRFNKADNASRVA
jgi:hypothetical protein